MGKASAVKKTLTSRIVAKACPTTMVRRHKDARLLVDRDSAAMVD